MKHILIVYGRAKGHGKMRQNIPEYYTDWVPEWIAANTRKWFVEGYKGLGPFPEELK